MSSATQGSTAAVLSVSSRAFANNGSLPSKYTCEGVDINPPLSIGNIPEETKTLAIIVDDPDVTPEAWVHWLIWNISPVSEIQEDAAPGIEGYNDFRKAGYNGPCPPRGTHHYHFNVYALDTYLPSLNTMSRQDIEDAMKGHIIGQGTLIGLYRKKG